MASTTDPSKPGTGLHGEGKLDELTDTGGTDSYATEERHGLVTGEFDREINLRAVLWSGVWLAVITIVANVLVWYCLRGFQIWDQHHEVPVMPMAAQNPQKTPQAPLLQPENPADDRNQDMFDLRAKEDAQLDRASQVGDTLRVPVDVAIDAIVKRGVAPFPATGAGAAPGTAGTAAPAAQSPQPETPKPPAR